MGQAGMSHHFSVAWGGGCMLEALNPILQQWLPVLVMLFAIWFGLLYIIPSPGPQLLNGSLRGVLVVRYRSLRH
jgi:hypothetical protein